MDPRDVVLVTGANTGLGYQIIRALCGSDEAYNILLGGRSLPKAQQAVASAIAEFSSLRSKLSPIQVDIEDDNSIQKAFEEVESKFGRLDVLINNAGMVRTGCDEVRQQLTDHRRPIRPAARLRQDEHARDMVSLL